MSKERVPHPGVSYIDERGEGESPASAHEFLEDALFALGDRAAERDVGQERSMARAVKIFNAATGLEMKEERGWLFMICLKMARDQGGRFKEDDIVDLAGYAALYGECRVSKTRYSRSGSIQKFDPSLLDRTAELGGGPVIGFDEGAGHD